MNSKHPYYRVLIPNTLYMKKKLFHKGPKGSQLGSKNVMISRNYFCTGCPKSGVLTKFSGRKKFHKGIRNQKFGKLKKFQVWVV